jgi:acylphosphatase
MGPANSIQRKTVYYSGHVQGVGFRYTVRTIARRFDVTGFVRNLSDGRVELVAEGSAAELESFLRLVRSEMGHHIRDEKLDTQPGNREFDGFEIRP